MVAGEDDDLLREAGLGIDMPLPLTAATVTDTELLQYLASPATSHLAYHLVRLACSFRQGVGERFAQADLTIKLRRRSGGEQARRGDPAGPPQAIAWSMTPLLLLDGDIRTDTLTIGADFQFVKAEASREVKNGESPLVRAYGLLTANPSWRIRATRVSELEGVFTLGLIVSSPKLIVAGGDITLDVVVEKAGRLGRHKSAVVKGAARVDLTLGRGNRPGEVRDVAMYDLLDEFRSPTVLGE